ncbi:kinase-like domain-containing protein [Phlebopus sp. FC_14]|nr:kinase-like domain-containing protein [Phlebopus sp. FC_14]
MKDTRPRYRFAAPYDTKHAYPLSHAPDKADLRPDFVVLPIDAFHKKQKRGQIYYEPKKEWHNFTMVRLTGECKNSDDASGVQQVQSYMRATRRAQPWLRFVTAMVVTREVVNFMRGDASGMERVKMRLERGRSCLEFVRLLMAIVLCEAELFGKSSHIALTTQTRTVQVSVPKSETGTSSAAATGQGQVPFTNDVAPTPSAQVSSHRNLRSSTRNSATRLPLPANTRATRSSSSSILLTASSGSYATRSGEKRKRTDEDDAKLMPPPASKKEVHEEVECIVQVPTILFGIFVYDGLLFTGASIRGRGTVVFVVHRKDTPQIKVALKMAWQDVARKPRRDEVIEILSKHPHENVLLPIPVQVDEDSTLRIIRAFTQTEVNAENMRIEDRILEIHETTLRRPVRYFWSVQDFVQGLLGALLGHQYLVEINILHRDVSENNVVLAVDPSDPRGAIMDFDMAIRYEQPKRPSQSLPTNESMISDPAPGETSGESRNGPFKAERTGTTPYMSFRVLAGKEHTHYDDIESFFYVLLLFFFSYNGPLPTNELKDAHDRGFIQVLGLGRARNIRDWPAMFLPWSASMSAAFHSKYTLLSRELGPQMFKEMTLELKKLWGASYTPVATLIARSLDLFQDRSPDNRVTHAEFVQVLEKWLEEFPQPLDGCNSCPFYDQAGAQYI